MAITAPIEGRYVDLRCCTEDDAEFTRDIRRDPEFVKFLPAIDNTLEEQKAWIRHQREKEGDYFFVVWDKAGKRIGTISIYDVHDDHAESGRLAIKGDNALLAIEAQLLSFRFAFSVLGLECIDGFILADNKRAIRFNKLFEGCQYPPELDENGKTIIRLKNWREDFEKADKKLSSILYRVKEQLTINSNGQL